MDFVISKDGTKIAYGRSGSGSPLVIVGGSLVDHSFYTPLASELARDFTVYVFDRRNRGESGDTLPYNLEREVEDIAAILDLIGEPVILYGHSAGSALILNVAASEVSVARLILADPPYTPHGNNDTQFIAQFKEEAAKVQEQHDRGNHKDNVTNFLGGMGLPENIINDTLNSPAGVGMIACAKALPYDYAVLGNGLVPAELAQRIKIPTSILVAGYSLDAGKQLADAMPDAEVKTLLQSTHEMTPADIANLIKEILK